MNNKIKISRWIIYKEFGTQGSPYIINLSKENINEDEIALCIQEQIYE